MRFSVLSRKLASFAVVPFLGAVSPLLLYPVIARRTSLDGWASVALGQSLGALAMLVVTMGWNLQGPRTIARAGHEDRPRIYLESALVRGAVFVVSTPVLVAAALVLATEGWTTTVVLMALAVASTGLTPAWFAVSTGDARTLLRFDALPRVVGALVSAVLLLAGFPLVTFPIVLLTFSLLGSGLFLGVVLRGAGLRPPGLRTLLGHIRQLVPAATSEVAAGSFAAGAVAVVGLGATVPQLAVYASGDRVFRLSLYSIATLSNALQAWVSEVGSPQEEARRFRSSLRLHLGLGVIGGAAIAALVPWTTGLLFGARLSVDNATAAGLGVAFLMISLGTSYGRHLLLPHGHRRAFLIATLVALGCGVPALVGFSRAAGAAGGAWAVALAEGALTVTLAVFARRLVRLPAPDAEEGHSVVEEEPAR